MSPLLYRLSYVTLLSRLILSLSYGEGCVGRIHDLGA